MDMLKAGLTPIVIFNGVLWLFFTFAYFYQFAYIIRVIMHGDVRLPKAKKNHSYAFVIAAHNEEPVIANLVRSILTQNYDGLIDCFVVADACTDATAEEAKRAGAITWERNDLARKGKSWVLDYAFDRILNEYGDKYEAFFIMDADNIAELIAGMRHTVMENLASRYISDDQVRQNWDIPGLEAALRNEFGLAVDIQNHWLQANPNMSAKQITDGLVETLEHIQQEKEAQVGADIMRRVEKYIALQTIDTQWKQHLATMDMLRQAIWLRSRAQKDPKREYQRESFELFKDLLDHIQFEIVRVMAHIQFQAQNAADEAEAMQQQAQRQHDAELARAQYHGSSDSSEALREPTPEEIARTGRNDPCPCGSGKRLKDCHGKLA